jgi:hypothetical protein
MPKSKPKKKAPSFFEMFSRLDPSKPKQPLVLNKNTRVQLEKLDPPVGPPKKKK